MIAGQAAAAAAAAAYCRPSMSNVVVVHPAWRPMASRSLPWLHDAKPLVFLVKKHRFLQKPLIFLMKYKLF